MKSLKELMSEMGFRADAPMETQKAFLKHLISAANEQESKKIISAKTEKNKITQTKVARSKDKTLDEKKKSTQLEFDFSSDNSSDKRVS